MKSRNIINNKKFGFKINTLTILIPLTEIKQFHIPIFSTLLIIGSFNSLQKLIINTLSNFKYLIKALFLVIFKHIICYLKYIKTSNMHNPGFNCKYTN